MTWPSTWPELHVVESPAVTASKSLLRPLTRECSWEVVGQDTVRPVRELVSAEVVEHLGEVVDVPCGGVEVGAGRADLLQFRGVGEALGVRHDPADDAAGLRSRSGLWPGDRLLFSAWLARRSEGAEVAAEALDAPGESAPA